MRKRRALTLLCAGWGAAALWDWGHPWLGVLLATAALLADVGSHLLRTPTDSPNPKGDTP